MVAAAVSSALVITGCGTPAHPGAEAPTATTGAPARHAAPSTPTPTSAPTSPSGPMTPNPMTPSPTGSYRVDTLVLGLIDRSRPTVSHGRLVSSERALTTTVWYPAERDGPYPLIVFAHGFEVGLTPYRRICRLWASAGYVVAAPAFPLTDGAVAGPNLDERDVVNQPGDVGFVISSILSRSASGASPLLHLVRRGDVAVAGHSDGADTALAVGYLPATRDRRVRAVVADGADALTGVSPDAPLTSSTPLLLVHGTADTVVPFDDSVEVTRQLHAPGWFVQLIGADHLPPIQGPSRWTALLDAVTTDFFDVELKGAPAGAIAPVVAASPVAHLVELPT